MGCGLEEDWVNLGRDWDGFFSGLGFDSFAGDFDCEGLLVLCLFTCFGEILDEETCCCSFEGLLNCCFGDCLLCCLG